MTPAALTEDGRPKARRFRTCWLPLPLDGGGLSLLAVENLEALVNREALLRDELAGAEPPYWAHLWTGSKALARRLAALGVGPGQRLLDAGCGLGAVALAAAWLGAKAFASDRAREPLACLSVSARANGLCVLAWQGDLLRPGTRTLFDWVCAADVTYDPMLQRGLLALAEEQLAPGGTLLCADSVRTYDTGWLVESQQRGWHVESWMDQEEEQGRPVWVRFSILKRSGAAGHPPLPTQEESP